MELSPSSGPGSGSYAGLVWTLVRTDLKTRYHGSVGGFLWALLKPATMFGVLLLVFSFIFKAEVDYAERLVIGLFLWDFFAEATRSGLGSLHAKGYLIGKARFPRWILVVTSISNPLLMLVAFWIVLNAYLWSAGRAPGARELGLFLLYLLALAAVTIGFSLAASVVFLRLRDLNQIWEVATQAGFFVAPIVWPIGTVPERFHPLLYLWPPTPIIEFSRSVLLTGRAPTPLAHAYLALEVLIVLVVGSSVYRALVPRAAEHL